MLIFGIFLPLVIFGILVLEINQNPTGFLWDNEILLGIHKTANQLLDQLAPILTYLGGLEGTLLLSILVLLVLGWQQKWKKFFYLIVVIGGSYLIAVTAKLLFHRIRPRLWESLYPFPLDFAFPSGHAMWSLTLAIALMIIAWQSRWRIWVAIFSSLFVIVIAWTRLYLGVHFPSDILGGWLLSLVWTISVSLLFNLRKNLTYD